MDDWLKVEFEKRKKLEKRLITVEAWEFQSPVLRTAMFQSAFPIDRRWALRDRARNSNFHCGLINLRAPHRLLIGLPSISCSSSCRPNYIMHDLHALWQDKMRPAHHYSKHPAAHTIDNFSFLLHTPPPFQMEINGVSPRWNMKTALFPSQWAAGRIPARISPALFNGGWKGFIIHKASMGECCSSNSGGTNQKYSFW